MLFVRSRYIGMIRTQKILVLEAGPFLVHEHIQNLGNVGLGVPSPIHPQHPDAQRTRDIVWGIPWRGNQVFPGLAYCVGGKSLFWGGWAPRLTDADLGQWPAAARNSVTSHYPGIE